MFDRIFLIVAVLWIQRREGGIRVPTQSAALMKCDVAATLGMSVEELDGKPVSAKAEGSRP